MIFISDDAFIPHEVTLPLVRQKMATMEHKEQETPSNSSFFSNCRRRCR